MNPLTQPAQDNDLRFLCSLFLSGLKIDQLDGIQVYCEKRIIDRSRQFPRIPRFVPQEFVEGTQQPDVVDYEVCASSFRHDVYRLWAGVRQRTAGGGRTWDIYMTLGASSRPL